MQTSRSISHFKGVRPPELIPKNFLQFYQGDLKNGKKPSDTQQQFLAQVLLHELDESGRKLEQIGLKKKFEKLDLAGLFQEVHLTRHQIEMQKIYDLAPQNLGYSLKVRNHEEGECVTRLGTGRLVGFCAQGYNTSFRNEDAYLVLPEKSFFMLCDGLSTNVSGNIASGLLIDFIEYGLQRMHSLEESLLFAHAALLQRMKNDVSLGGFCSMASTLSCCKIEKNSAQVYHIGDTKILILRNGKIIYESKDHTKGQDLYAEKLIDVESAHALNHSLTRYLGNEPILISRDLDHRHIELEKGDRLLICSDGISHAFQGDDFHLGELCTLACEKVPLEEILTHIYQMALQRAQEGKNGQGRALNGQNISLLLYEH
ncbi:MAG: serine/threonine-protein phosphatase [Deltaproteobacteria bacterium]|nr:serine/threonine-protein phosphatase [Deltaproteobacteria bacterium]